MAFPKPIEPHGWHDVPPTDAPQPPQQSQPTDADAEELDEDTEAELEADFDDSNILDALAFLARELDEAVLEVDDDDAGKEKPAATAP